MSTQLQDTQAKAPPQPPAKEEAAKSITPPAPAAPPQGGGAGPRRHPKLKRWLIVAAVVLVLAGVGFAWAKYTGTDLRASLTAAWHRLMGNDVPKGFAQTNGRPEATKIYITTKAPLRVESILAREGDRAEPGQVLARMDTRTLQAQLRQAEAKVQSARDAKASAIAQAMERETALALAKSQLERSKKLIEKGGASQQLVDIDEAKWKVAGSALESSKSQIVEAQAAIDAALADADKLRVDIEDGVLVAPRRGRIQYR